MSGVIPKRVRWELVGVAAILLAAPAVNVHAQTKTATKPAAKPPVKQTSSQPKKATTKVGTSTARKKAPIVRRARAQAAPTAERIREIQEALARAGYFQQEASGKWDAQSVDAMKRFQQASGFPATGKIDARSLQKLGLGSSVAGASAPIPPPAERGPNVTPPNQPK